jgi:hypothetical protein
MTTEDLKQHEFGCKVLQAIANKATFAVYFDAYKDMYNINEYIEFIKNNGYFPSKPKFEGRDMEIIKVTCNWYG